MRPGRYICQFCAHTNSGAGVKLYGKDGIEMHVNGKDHKKQAQDCRTVLSFATPAEVLRTRPVQTHANPLPQFVAVKLVGIRCIPHPTERCDPRMLSFEIS